MKTKLLLVAIFFLAVVLRLYSLGGNPPSLYWDEASLGYNAWSISQTLHDEHGEFLPIARFIAFGDYKPPGYIYAAAATIKLFGLSEFSIRLPSALAGAFLVLVSYFLAKEFLNIKIALVAALFVAFSPWSLQMSRAAFEANLATLFSSLGIYLFLRNKLFFSAIFLVLSLYTFNSHRIFVPIIVAALSFIHFKKYLLFYLLCFILLLPLLPHMLSREGSLRFQEVAWINDTVLVEKANRDISFDGNTWWAKIIHNRRVIYAQEFLKHYSDNFKTDFLFFNGDVNPKLSIQTVGEMYWLDLPLIIAGIYFLIRFKNRYSLVIFLWILLAPIPAAFARETPHALRILPIIPIPQIIAATGLVYLLKMQKIFACVLILLFFCYLRDYYYFYPKNYSMDWEYGYKQAVAATEELRNNYDYVSVTNKYGRPYIYFLLYSQYPVEKYWQTRKVDRDWYGFWYVHAFDKYVFDDQYIFTGRGLFIREPEATPPGAKIISLINNLKGETVFNIYEK